MRKNPLVSGPRSTLELGRLDELLNEAPVIRPLVAGNWKMNGLRASAGEAAKIRDELGTKPVDIDVMICPPATVLPVQIYLWADSPERAFVERTSAAIMVLLVFLIAMNA